MNLRRQLQRADKQLAELHDEQGERFDLTLSIIARALQLALKANAAEAAKVVENVSRPLSPNAGRRLLAAMLATLPADTTLDPPQAARKLEVSPDTVRGWIRTGQLKASNIATDPRPRWIIQRSDLDSFLQSRQPQPQAAVTRRKRRSDDFKKYRD